MQCRDMQTAIFCDPDPALIFKTKSNSNHNPKSFFKCKVQVQIKSEKFKNSAFSQEKFRISFPLTQSDPDPKF